jgi:hypothetical protein
MSVAAYLLSVIDVGLALEINEDLEVRTLAKNLGVTCGHILYWHQPRYCKIHNVGYTCLEQPAQQCRLLAALKCLKSILPTLPSRSRGATYRPRKTLRLMPLSTEDKSKIRELTLQLGRLILEERLMAYIPYSLGKLKRLRGWRNSPFGEMDWGKLNSSLLEQNSDLLDLITSIATTYDYDPAVIKVWIQLRAEFVTKDFYVSRTIEDLKLAKLADRVWWDQEHQTLITMDETDLTTRALLLAFWTFRNEWYKDIGSGPFYVHTKMACKWIGQRWLRLGDVERARRWLNNDGEADGEDDGEDLDNYSE